MALYDINGNVIQSGSTIVNATIANAEGRIIKSVSHRGATTSGGAGAGYLSQYKYAREVGFLYGENDMNFTKDGIPIMRHDGTIPVNGANKSIAAMTYEELIAVDSKIPTLAEFLNFCKCIGMYPYLDTKRWSGTWSLDNLTIALNICAESGILRDTTWIIGTIDEASHILAFDERARIGWLAQPTEANMTSLLALKTDKNDLFFDSDYNGLTSENIQRCIDNKIPLEVYTLQSESAILSLHPYVTGVTANGTLVASSIYYNANMT